MKVNFVNLGCPKNLVDSENLIGFFKKEDISSYHKADTVIINTCGFIEQAKRESIEHILKAIEDGKKVLVTGCLVYRYKEELQKEIPEAVFFENIKDLDSVELLETPKRQITTRHYAYLKIAEGCNRKCSFCAIPSIRGHHRSKSIEELVDEAKYLKDNDVKELIIVSQDTLYYQEDNSFKSIIKLLEALEKLDFPWIRLMYLYPNSITDELIDFIDNSKSILPYFDIPLQHISDNVLKSMRRGYTKKDIFRLLEKINAMKHKKSILRSSFIVGYPTEEEKDFEELLDFISQKIFQFVGVFEYSHEEGTFAYKLEDKIPKEEKQRRYKEVFNLSQDILEEKNTSLIGQEVDILIEKKDKGRTFFQAPEIDGIVILDRPSAKTGIITKAKVIGNIGADLLVNV
ncbi:30S ribosomal protein S12 methylthiotransferase RimO [Hydrogenobaculum acidophilum]